MSAPLQDAPAADTEGEKPVREQLSKATIEAEAKAADEAAMSEDALAETGAHSTGLENGTISTHEVSDRGRSTRKRSFDETEEDGSSGMQRTASARLPRKRSRENPEEAESTRVSGEHVRESLNGNGRATSTSDEIQQPEQTRLQKEREANLNWVMLAAQRRSAASLKRTRAMVQEPLMIWMCQTTPWQGTRRQLQSKERTWNFHRDK